MVLGELYDTTAAGADHLAGSTDEAFHRATEDLQEGDLAGVGDHLAGSTDEAVGQATDAAVEGEIEGVLDAAAGNTDEAVGRAVEDTQEGDASSYVNNLTGGTLDPLFEAGHDVETVSKEGRQTEGTGWAGAVDDFTHDLYDTTTGSSSNENLGWFGEADKHLDYRSLTGEKDPNNPDEWSQESGIDAALASLGQQGAAAAEDVQDASKWATPDWLDWFIEHPWMTGIGLLALYLFAISGGPMIAAKNATGG